MNLIAALLLTLAQDADRIQELIRKLGSDEYATREQATEELRKIGAPAREALKKAAEESTDPEVRQRAQGLLDGTRPEKPAPKDPPKRALPGRPGLGGGSSVAVRSVNGDTTYLLTPGDGSPPLTFLRQAAGPVKLDYTDEQGAAKSVPADSLAAFLKDNKELAAKYGITEDGIDYGGCQVRFKGQPFNFNFGPRPLPLPVPRPRPVLPPDEEEEGTPTAGAVLGKVDDSLRAQLEIPEGQGAVVLRVVPGSAAAALGLKKSDILLEADGKRVTSPESAKGLIRKDGSATVLRKGKKEVLGEKRDF